MTKQDVTNKCKEVAISTQAVLEATKNLSSLCSPTSASRDHVSETLKRENDKMLRDIKRVVDETLFSINNLVEAVNAGNKAGFVSEATSSAKKLAQLIETAKSLGIERDGAKLKQASLKIISTGKIALRSPQDALYKQHLASARESVEEAMRLCVMAIQSRLLAASKSTMESGVMTLARSNAAAASASSASGVVPEASLSVPQRRRTELPPSFAPQRSPGRAPITSAGKLANWVCSSLLFLTQPLAFRPHSSSMWLSVVCRRASTSGTPCLPDRSSRRLPQCTRSVPVETGPEMYAYPTSARNV
jgi:hypothetical protein